MLISLVATPICLFLGITSAGAGHGSYFLAKILFPFTILLAGLFGSITAPFMLLAVAQFPIYGIVFGAANVKDRIIPFAIGLLLAHVIAVAACFLLIGENFS